MNKAIVILLATILLHSCKKRPTIPEKKSTIDKNAACVWFPISADASYYYSLEKNQGNNYGLVHAITNDSTLLLDDYRFVHGACQTIYLSYRDMVRVPIFRIHGQTQRSDSSTTLRYYTTEQLNVGSIHYNGIKYITRQATITFTDKVTGKDSILAIDLIDQIGIQRILKMPRTSSATKTVEQYEIML